jgi:hypothetical protein
METGNYRCPFTAVELIARKIVEKDDLTGWLDRRGFFVCA